MEEQPVETIEQAMEAISELAKHFTRYGDVWENKRVDDYLEGMVGWLYGKAELPNVAPSWQLIVNMLSAARFYE